MDMPAPVEPLPRSSLTAVLPFLLAVTIDAWLWQVPLSPPAASPVTRVLPHLLGRLLDAHSLALLAVALHGVAAVLAQTVVRVSIGDGAASLLAGCVFALLPEPRAAVVERDVAVLLATCLGLGTIVLGLRSRPRPWGSASLYLLALACHPLVLPVPLLLALAWARPPVLHVAALLASAVARSRAFPGGASFEGSWWSHAMAGALEATGAAFAVPEWLAAGVLALAVAAGSSRRTLPWRVRVWCWFFVACALPWGVIVLEESRPGAGALTLAMLAVAALGSEVALRIARTVSD